MVGRFLGSAIMAKIAPNRYLASNATAAVALLGVAMLAGKASADIAMWALLAIGFFNSIMFPTIFSLATKVSGDLPAALPAYCYCDCRRCDCACGTRLGSGYLRPDDFFRCISDFVTVYIVFFAIKATKLTNNSS